jgi:hypothetical protein
MKEFDAAKQVFYFIFGHGFSGFGFFGLKKTKNVRGV